MTFPFIYESNFEQGTNAEWDSETDTAAQLDFPHYSELARFPWSNAAPASGAYCMRATLSGGTADAFVSEGDLDIAAAGTAYAAFNIYISPTFDATADDTINLLELREVGNAAMVTFGLRYVAATDVINFGIGKAAPTTFGAEPIETNQWYTVELKAVIDNAGANDGTIDIYVTKMGDKSSALIYAAQVATLDQTAVTYGVLGIQDHLATTTGVILFDDFKFDDTRIYSPIVQYPLIKLLTKTGHMFVGPGVLQNVSLMSGAGTDCVLTIYDTDTADILDASNIVVELKNTANNELVDMATFEVRLFKGAYVVLAGTTPRALLQIRQAARYGSVANMRDYGLKVK